MAKQSRFDNVQDVLARSMSREFPLYFKIDITPQERAELEGFLNSLGADQGAKVGAVVVIKGDAPSASPSISKSGRPKK